MYPRTTLELVWDLARIAIYPSEIDLIEVCNNRGTSVHKMSHLTHETAN